MGQTVTTPLSLTLDHFSEVEWPHEGTLHLDKILAVKIKTLQTPGGPLSKDQCAYCKEKGHWIKDCPKRTKKPEKPNAQALETQMDGKPVDFLVDTGFQHSVLLQDFEAKKEEIIGPRSHWIPDGPHLTDNKGDPIHVLTIQLEDECRLSEKVVSPEKDIDWWLQRFPRHGLKQMA
uniref:Bm7857 n=1 Tax=Brugia malayi TaxID=6279 RepID=A0A1I9G8N1_BRUMA|nr:Bm7857 [Brugia malayi]